MDHVLLDLTDEESLALTEALEARKHYFTIMVITDIMPAKKEYAKGELEKILGIIKKTGGGDDMNCAVRIGVFDGADVIPFPDHPGLDWYYSVIGCEYIEVVHPVDLPFGMIMLVDEEGLIKSNPLLNMEASAIYGTYEHGQPIVGNAMIIREEGCEFAPLGEDEAKELCEKIREVTNRENLNIIKKIVGMIRK